MTLRTRTYIKKRGYFGKCVNKKKLFVLNRHYDSVISINRYPDDLTTIPKKELDVLVQYYVDYKINIALAEPM